MKAANRAVLLLQRAGLPLGTVRVLTINGRLSGCPRSTPVSPLRVGGRTTVPLGGDIAAEWSASAGWRASG